MTDHPELDLLSAYLDGELDPAERAGVGTHLPACPRCRGVLAAIEGVVADVRALPPAEMTAGQVASLDASIARERQAAARRPGRLARWAWASGAAAASLIAVVALVHSRSAPQRAATPIAQEAQGASAGGAHFLASGTDYTDTTARADLLALARAGRAAFATKGNDAAASAPAAGTMSGAGVVPPQLARCDAGIQSRTPEGVEPVRFEQAKFKGTDAYLLFYLAPAGSPTRAELWVVRPADCFLLFFSQASLP